MMAQQLARAVGPLWHPALEGRPGKFGAALAYNPYISHIFRPIYGTNRTTPTGRTALEEQAPLTYDQILRNFGMVSILPRPAAEPNQLSLGCVPQPVHTVGAVTYYQCLGHPRAGLIQPLHFQPTTWGWRVPYQSNGQGERVVAFVAQARHGPQWEPYWAM